MSDDTQGTRVALRMGVGTRVQGVWLVDGVNVYNCHYNMLVRFHFKLYLGMRVGTSFLYNE